MCGCCVGGEDVVRSVLYSGYKIDYFVCFTPEQATKFKISGYYDYRSIASDYGIPVYHPKTYSLNNDQDILFFQENKFDLLIQGGWQRLFPEKVLAALAIGAIGIHGSTDFLPKGRGRSPMNWSLIEGRKRFMMHMFLIRPGVDDGDVFAIKDFDITDFDDIETLYYKYSITYRDMLLMNLPSLLDGKVQVTPQNGIPSYYSKRTEEDGEIDWEHMDVWEIYNFSRAQTHPYPGAFGEVDGKRYRIWRCRPFDTRITYPEKGYGQIVEKFGDRVIVNCRGGLLLLDEYDVES